MQRVLGGEEQDPAGTRHREPAQARQARCDGNREIECQERLAALGLATDDADGLIGPEPGDQPSMLLGALGET